MPPSDHPDPGDDRKAILSRRRLLIQSAILGVGMGAGAVLSSGSPRPDICLSEIERPPGACLSVTPPTRPSTRPDTRPIPCLRPPPRPEPCLRVSAPPRD
jgi:hypothetical protein